MEPEVDVVNLIRHAGDLQQWVNVQQRYGTQLSPQQISTSINALQKLAARRSALQLPPSVQHLLHERVADAWKMLDVSHGKRPMLPPRSFATILASLAKLQAPLTAAQQQAAVGYMENNFGGFKPIELVAVLQGLIKGAGGEATERGLHPVLPELILSTSHVLCDELPRLQNPGAGGQSSGGGTREMTQSRGKHEGPSGSAAGVTMQTAASFAWVCARVGVLPQEYFAQMCHVLQDQMPRLKTVELLNVMWACAKLRFRHEGLLAAVVEDVYGRVGTLTARDACQLAWALASLDVQNPAGFGLLARHVGGRLGELQPPDCVMLLWALARGGVAGDESHVVGQVTDHVLYCVGQYNLPQLSTVAWALAHGELDAPKFLSASSNRVLSLLNSCQSRRYDAQTTRQGSPSLANSTERVAEMNPSPQPHSIEPSVSNTHYDPYQQDAAAASGALQDYMPSLPMSGDALSGPGHVYLPPQALSNLLWACASSSYYNQAYFEALCAAVLPRARAFGKVEVASAAWALSEVRHYDFAVLEAFAARFAALCDPVGVETLRPTQQAWGQYDSYEPSAGDFPTCQGIEYGTREGEVTRGGGGGGVELSGGWRGSAGMEMGGGQRYKQGYARAYSTWAWKSAPGSAVCGWGNVWWGQERQQALLSVQSSWLQQQKQQLLLSHPQRQSWLQQQKQQLLQQYQSYQSQQWWQKQQLLKLPQQQQSWWPQQQEQLQQYQARQLLEQQRPVTSAASVGEQESNSSPSSMQVQQYEPLVPQLRARVPHVGTRELANVLLAFSRFDHRNEQLLEACSRAVIALWRELSTQPQHACNAVLALSSLGVLARERDRDLGQVVRALLKRLSSRELTYAQQTQMFQAEMLVQLDVWEAARSTWRATRRKEDSAKGDVSKGSVQKVSSSGGGCGAKGSSGMARCGREQVEDGKKSQVGLCSGGQPILAGRSGGLQSEQVSWQNGERDKVQLAEEGFELFQGELRTSRAQGGQYELGDAVAETFANGATTGDSEGQVRNGLISAEQQIGNSAGVGVALGRKDPTSSISLGSVSSKQPSPFRVTYDVKSAVVPPGMFYKGMKNWLRAALSPQRSSAQARISKLLREQLDVQGLAEEKLTKCKLFSVDIAITGRQGRDIALEVDGLTHYTVNPPHKPMSNTILRSRVLSAMGWAVTRIPEHEWLVVQQTGDTTRYLMAKLATAAQQLQPRQG